MEKDNYHPLVSIIIPAYNCEAYLGECLDSVLAQTYPYWECVVVDDGSTDGTFAAAESYSKRDNRIRCFRQENQGPSVARNNGIHASTGDYILPLDGDDIIEPTYIEKAIGHFEKQPETKLVYCQASFFGEKQGVWQLPVYNYDELLWNNLVFNSAVYRRSDYDKTSGYNPNMVYGFEDWDFWLSLLGSEDQVYRIDEVLFHYRIKNESRNSNNTTSYLRVMRAQIVNNHKEIYAPFTENIIDQKLELDELKCLLELTNKELNRVKTSKAYRLGKWIIAPFRWIKNIILL